MSWRTSIEQIHQQRAADGRWRVRSTVQSAQGPKIIVDGQTLDNFCGNDYLGLANSAELLEASIQAAQKFGVGSGASHLICGHQSPHEQLEKSLAAFCKAEKAIVFSTGYMANLAAAQAFASRDDVVIQDRLNHASLIDAGRSCDAKLVRYQHCNIKSLEEKLARPTTGKKIVMTDSVFSMDGDVAPLEEIKNLCDAHDALLIIDEAHGFGVLGAGRGAAAEAGIAPSGNVLFMGTLGKAAGSGGAFLAGDSTLIEHVIQFGRTYIYTTAIPPHVAAASLRAVELIQNSLERIDRLHLNVNRFKALLAAKKAQSILDRLLPSSTAIQPLLIGDEKCSLAASELLKSQRILVLAIRPPTVPEGSSRLRITLSAAHDESQIARLVDCLCSQSMTDILGAHSHPKATEPS